MNVEDHSEDDGAAEIEYSKVGMATPLLNCRCSGGYLLVVSLAVGKVKYAVGKGLFFYFLPKIGMVPEENIMVTSLNYQSRLFLFRF